MKMSAIVIELLQRISLLGYDIRTVSINTSKKLQVPLQNYIGLRIVSQFH